MQKKSQSEICLLTLYVQQNLQCALFQGEDSLVLKGLLNEEVLVVESYPESESLMSDGSDDEFSEGDDPPCDNFKKPSAGCPTFIHSPFSLEWVIKHNPKAYSENPTRIAMFTNGISM